MVPPKSAYALAGFAARGEAPAGFPRAWAAEKHSADVKGV